MKPWVADGGGDATSGYHWWWLVGISRMVLYTNVMIALNMQELSLLGTFLFDM